MRIDQYLTDLTNYHSDADRASWQPLNVDGPAWELLGNIAKNGEHTAAAISQQFSQRRGYSADEYTVTLNNLVTQGWATENDGLFSLTEAGRTVRETIEQKTDNIFFATWAELSNGQLAQLLRHLLQMQHNIRTLVGAKVAAERQDIWPRVQALTQALFQLVGQRTKAAREALGLNRPLATLALLTAYGHENNLIMVTHLRKRFPYIHPQTVSGYLHSLVATGELQPRENGAAQASTLTDKGRQVVQRHLDSFWGEVAALQPIPKADIARLAELFDRVVESIARISRHSPCLSA